MVPLQLDWIHIQEILDKWKPGWTEADWWGLDNPFEKLLGSILVQHTTWSNASRGLKRLRAKGWNRLERVARVPDEQLMEAIRPAGFYQNKAATIHRVCRWLNGYGGIRPVAANFSRDRLREELLTIKGIGPETADMLLLYVFGKTSFIGDAYTRRLMLRLRGVKMDDRDIRQSVLSQIRNQDVLRRFHALIVELGKEHCKKRRPRCHSCPFREECIYAEAGGETGGR